MEETTRITPSAAALSAMASRSDDSSLTRKLAADSSRYRQGDQEGAANVGSAWVLSTRRSRILRPIEGAFMRSRKGLGALRILSAASAGFQQAVRGSVGGGRSQGSPAPFPRAGKRGQRASTNRPTGAIAHQKIFSITSSMVDDRVEGDPFLDVLGDLLEVALVLGRDDHLARSCCAAPRSPSPSGRRWAAPGRRGRARPSSPGTSSASSRWPGRAGPRPG